MLASYFLEARKGQLKDKGVGKSNEGQTDRTDEKADSATGKKTYGV